MPCRSSGGALTIPVTNVTQCDGTVVAMSSLPVNVNGFVFTRPCPGVGEFDKSTWCEIVGGVLTGVKVQIITSYTALGVPINAYYNLVTGAVWAGNPQTELVQCADADLESDVITMCDNGTTTFFRWIVKQNGTPTGVSFDTTTTGAVYVPVGPVTVGDCNAASGVEVIEMNLQQVDGAGNPTGGVIKETRTYDENGVLLTTVYTDTVTGLVVPLAGGTTQLAPVHGLDKEAIVMCDGTNTFIRHIVYSFGVNSLLAVDTTLDGVTPYVTLGPVTAGACSLPAVARTLLGTESFNVDVATNFPTLPVGTGHVEWQAHDGNVLTRTGSVPTALLSIKVDEGVFNEISDPVEIAAKQFLGETLGVTVYAEYWNVVDSVF